LFTQIAPHSGTCSSPRAAHTTLPVVRATASARSKYASAFTTTQKPKRTENIGRSPNFTPLMLRARLGSSRDAQAAERRLIACEPRARGSGVKPALAAQRAPPDPRDCSPSSTSA
jgi:hypothetical protein